jgi:hypothetical protein
MKHKTKAGLYMHFFILESLLVHDCFHGDLHNGNWKMENDTLIVYDCGLIHSSGDLEYNKKIFECMTANNYVTFLEYNKNADKAKIQKVSIKINDYKKFTKPSERFMVFLKESIKHKLLTDKRIINIFNSYAMSYETIKCFVDNFKKYIYFENDSDISILLYSYIEIMKNLDIFHDLKHFLEDYMGSDVQNKVLFDNWLYKEFGHNDAKLIFNIICSNIDTQKNKGVC